VPSDPDAFHGERRRSRERALELGYEAESKALTLVELIAELPVAPEEYGLRLAAGLGARLDEVDGLVASHSSGWAVERMPAVDRWILRIGTYELLAEPEVPFAVVIDEAVELAKEYSTEDSGRFVNGVLAAVAASVRPEETTTTGTSSAQRPS
jgi:N utilization substance protein B